MKIFYPNFVLSDHFDIVNFIIKTINIYTCKYIHYVCPYNEIYL